jgi:hypothetical protein
MGNVDIAQSCRYDYPYAEAKSQQGRQEHAVANARQIPAAWLENPASSRLDDYGRTFGIKRFWISAETHADEASNLSPRTAPKMRAHLYKNVVDRSYLELGLREGAVMKEHDRANKLMVLTMTVVSFLVAGSVGLVWSSGNALPSKPIAEVPQAKAQVASPQVDAVAMLDKRLVEVESKMKVPPSIRHLSARSTT